MSHGAKAMKRQAANIPMRVFETPLGPLKMTRAAKYSIKDAYAVINTSV
jgi:hypothetical protein